MTKLGKWLDLELKRRGWSHRELARRTEFSQTAVSQAVSGKRGIGLDFCVKVADVLGEPPENILRLADLLPPLPPGSAVIDEVASLLKHLPEEDKRDILDYARLRYSRREARAHPFRMEPPSTSSGRSFDELRTQQPSLGPLFDFMPPAPPPDLPAETAERIQMLMEEFSAEERAGLLEHLLKRRDFVEALRRRGLEIQRRATAEIPAASNCVEPK